MFASRLLHPDAAGRITENGNRIGEFTIEGTIGLVLFGGLLSGLIAGVVWVLVKEWIPSSSLAVGFGAVAIGGAFLVQSDNRDFRILRDPTIDLVLLLGMIFLFGVALYGIDRLLDRRLPDASGAISIVVYALIAAAGTSFLIPTFGSLLSAEFCFCAEPPIWTGTFLLITTFATIWWWVLSMRGTSTPPRALKLVGTASVVSTVVAGSIYLVIEVVAIL